jgi:hypothetical protein
MELDPERENKRQYRGKRSFINEKSSFLPDTYSTSEEGISKHLPPLTN